MMNTDDKSLEEIEKLREKRREERNLSMELGRKKIGLDCIEELLNSSKAKAKAVKSGDAIEFLAKS